MEALIIGGSGGLSSVVAKTAMKNNYRVWTVTRGEHKLPDGVNALKADRNDAERLKEVLGACNMKWDIVFDCICMNRTHAMDDLKILPAFTDRLVVVSTDSVYDGRYKRIPEKEDGICVEENGADEECSYAGNKRRMEEVFLQDIRFGASGLKITIFRPGHIYGPGFLLGCFPEHSRQKELPELIMEGKTIRLVGMGTYVIHPIYVDDLAETLVDCADNPKTYGQVFCIGGPEAVENKTYYETIAECLGVGLNLEEIPLAGYLEKHPEYSGHLCHRVYDLTKLRETGVKMPSVHLKQGIAASLKALGYPMKKIIFLGSSVTYGEAAGGVSFADILCKKNGYEMVKEAVSGTTLVDESADSYVSRLKMIEEPQADLFVCQLSTNDATCKKSLGRVSVGRKIDRFDKATVAGAIEYIIAYAQNKWKCPVMFYTGPGYESREYADMVVLLKEIAKKWNIKLIDLWSDTAFNAVSPEEYARFMADPIHPTLAGYEEWWTPYFEERINSVLKKQET